MVITTFEFDEYVHDGERRCTSAGPRVAQLIGPPSLLEAARAVTVPLEFEPRFFARHLGRARPRGSATGRGSLDGVPLFWPTATPMGSRARGSRFAATIAIFVVGCGAAFLLGLVFYAATQSSSAGLAIPVSSALSTAAWFALFSGMPKFEDRDRRGARRLHILGAPAAILRSTSSRVPFGVRAVGDRKSSRDPDWVRARRPTLQGSAP